MDNQIVSYMLEVQTNEFLFENSEEYARDEVKASRSRVWGLFKEPQPGCPPEPVVYRGWCWLMPKYSHPEGRCPPAFYPLYQGPVIHEPSGIPHGTPDSPGYPCDLFS